ncbi:MAG: putative beta-lysine N-acetyltransferase [Desulfovermiculus sp.]
MHHSPDLITTVGHSVIQFGPLNDRVYLMKLASPDLPRIVHYLESLAQRHCLTKICAKVPQPCRALFEDRGFVQEANIPGLFDGRQDGLYLAKFLDHRRSFSDTKCPHPPEEHNCQKLISPEHHEGHLGQQTEHPQHISRSQDLGVTVRRMGVKDCPSIAGIFARNFSAYPFPLYDLDYLQECMQTNVCFFGAEIKGQIAALASSEMDEAAGHVEMTDFITLPVYRGHGLATMLLKAMEQAMQNRGLQTAFSIARAGSLGMNTVFARYGYTYCGRLVQNTCFNGGLEDMNVWSKGLCPHA